MIYNAKEITLNDGTKARFRSPRPDDCTEMLRYLYQSSAETVFLMRYPEECENVEEKQERAFLEKVCTSDNETMIACEINGRIVGNCQISFNTRLKTRHRASVAIAILKEYWGRGIGTAMFNEMTALARQRGIYQLELDFIEGNERARALYEKMGFRIVAERPDAIRLKDGTMLREYSMVKKL